MEFLQSPRILAVVAVAAAALGLGAAGVLYRSLSRTTLNGAVTWAGLAFVAVGMVEAAAVLSDVGSAWWLPPLRFAAAVFSFCPLMSVLGARRPHHVLWQFIVFSLWGMLILPALEVGLLRPGRALEVHDLRGWFLWVLLAVQFINYPPFLRYGWAAMVVCGCQAVLLAEHLPLVRTLAPDWLRVAAIAASTAAWVICAVLVARSVRPETRGLQTVWFDFRDLYGTLWAMRIAQRINGAAELNDWSLRASLGGFYDSASGQRWEDSDESHGLSDALRTNLRNLFRRFFDEAWFANRAD